MTTIAPQIRTLLIRGSTIEKYNAILTQEFQKHNINTPILFDMEELQKHVMHEGNFFKGLIQYLKAVDDKLDNVTDNSKLKVYVFQIIAEISTLVYPNTGASYPLIPQDLKKIDWAVLTHAFDELIQESCKQQLKKCNQLENVAVNLATETSLITQSNKNTHDNRVKYLFANHFFLPHPQGDYPKLLICIISISLCKELIRSIDKAFISKSFKKEELDNAEDFLLSGVDLELKRLNLIKRLSQDVNTHMIGLAKDNNIKFTDDEQELLHKCCVSLAVYVTQILEKNKLFVSKSQTTEKNNVIKRETILIWRGTNLLAFPKKLALPMIHEPTDWTVTDTYDAEQGGFLLSEFTNISYQGYLDSKSFQVHNHKLLILEIQAINKLQKVQYSINGPMVEFIKNNSTELTELGILLITDKWMSSNRETRSKLALKWKQVYRQHRDVRFAIMNEEIKNRSETMNNQNIIQVADLFQNKAIYWPAVYDFRGRIYGISNLNLQMNQFARSVICFYSDKKPVSHRKKSQKVFEHFNLLLKEILNKDELIAEWDAHFGNRFLNNKAFEKLLFASLKDNRLSFIQVGQLLQLRHKDYDKIGIYYDASASAYQIIGMINLDTELCQLTNVIAKPNNSNYKADIYEYFKVELMNQIKQQGETITQIGEEKDQTLNAQVREVLSEQLDRELIKSIIMPLIYGILLYFKVKQRKLHMALLMIYKISLLDIVYIQKKGIY
jgi:hypothetical protein